MHRIRTLIIGAAGRDFHNFNMLYRGDSPTRSSASRRSRFRTSRTAATLPELAGPLYPGGIPIIPKMNSSG
jgi:predicted GTPase